MLDIKKSSPQELLPFIHFLILPYNAAIQHHRQKA